MQAGPLLLQSGSKDLLPSGHETGDAISTEEWNARRAAGKCSCCGLAGHTYKKDNKLMCPNLPNAATHASITTAKANPTFNKQA